MVPVKNRCANISKKPPKLTWGKDRRRFWLKINLDINAKYKD